MNISKELVKIAKSITRKSAIGDPLRVKITQDKPGYYSIHRFHHYLGYKKERVIPAIINLMDEQKTLKAVVNGIVFEAKNRGSLEVELKLLFKKYKILD